MVIVHFCTQVRDKVERHGSYSRVKALWEHMCSKVQVWVIKMGFGPFLTLLVLKADRVLITALTERWSPMTCTFHFPPSEIGMPPIDFYMMLPIGGTPSLLTNELDLDMVRRCLGS